MTVLTLYFAGSGHGIDKGIDDDSMVEAYNQTMGRKAFFPGPGGDPRIYVAGFDGEQLRRQLNVDKGLPSDEHGTLFGYNAKISGPGVRGKRGLTGKGWDRSVWFALNLLAAQLKSGDGRLTLNLVGHSRGSITIIMLLNDMFFEHTGQGLGDAGRFRFNEAGVHAEWKGAGQGQGGAGFGAWYRKQLEAVWLRRMGTTAALSRRLAKQGIAALETIKQHQGEVDAINAWLFDPVAGINEGAGSRKQQFPAHPLIKRVRVLRMEEGGAGGLLSTNMPTFPGWSFLDGLHGPRNLAVFADHERFVIPLPGSHGAGLSINLAKGVANETREQWYIGTSYMVHLLQACGTQFQAGFVERWHNDNLMLAAYNTLFSRFEHVSAGHGELNPARGHIHGHHTPEGYVVDAVNAHHLFLKQQHPHFPT